MPDPSELAQRRLQAIAQLEAQIAAAAEGAQRDLYERLLASLNDIQADPTTLYSLLAEYQRTTLVPLAYTYAQALLHLPALNVRYFEALEVAGYHALRAPLTDFLAGRLGIDAAGNAVKGGYLDLMAGNTAVSQQVLRFAFGAQASGVGVEAYKAGLQALVLGGDKPAEGLVGTLYREASDDFARADRQLQALSAERLGLQAYLFQGGLIATSRPFCVARNGKVFLHSEIEKFGTKEDKYPGYTNKSEGLFSGKVEPYSPFTDLGGANCRHYLHALPALVAIRLRPELKQDTSGKLYLDKN